MSGRIIICIVLSVIGILTGSPELYAQGFFGPPQGYSREGKGLYTAIGYLFIRDRWKDDHPYLMKEKIVYSEAGYGFSQGVEIYGRLGFTDGTFCGPIGYKNSTISTNDLKSDDRFLGTIGLRWSHGVNKSLRWGIFIQGSYFFNDGADEISGLSASGIPFNTEVRIKDEWQVKAGIGLQVKMTDGMRIYGGPYLYRGEGRVTTSPPLTFIGEKIKSGFAIGAYGGIVFPLYRRFQLTTEGWYTENFSMGTMITYSY